MKSNVIKLFRATLFAGVCVTLVSLMPQMYNYLIRDYVGGKVVKLTAGRSGGTGFHVKMPSGKVYIMTNNHICNLADKKGRLQAYLNNSLLPTVVNVVKQSKKHDLCLVSPLRAVKGLYVADNVNLGEMISLIGHPALRPITVSKGEVIGEKMINLMFGTNLPDSKCLGKTKLVKDMSDGLFKIMMQLSGVKSLCMVTLKGTMISAISYGGNSGSPVVDVWGNVVGVLFAGSGQVTDAYMVPLDDIKRFIDGK